MNFNLLTGILQDTDSSGKPLLIAAILGTLFFFMTLAIKTTYLFTFKKKEYLSHFVNKRLFIIWYCLFAAFLPFVILIWVYGYGLLPGSNIDGSTETVQKIVQIIFTIFVFSLPVIYTIYIFLYLHYLAMGIDEKYVYLLGELFLISNIEKIEDNEKQKEIIITYKKGQKTSKILVASKASLAGKFIIENAEKMNQKITAFVEESPEVKKENKKANKEKLKEAKKALSETTNSTKPKDKKEKAAKKADKKAAKKADKKADSKTKENPIDSK